MVSQKGTALSGVFKLVKEHLIVFYKRLLAYFVHDRSKLKEILTRENKEQVFVGRELVTSFRQADHFFLKWAAENFAMGSPAPILYAYFSIF